MMYHNLILCHDIKWSHCDVRVTGVTGEAEDEC